MKNHTKEQLQNIIENAEKAAEEQERKIREMRRLGNSWINSSFYQNSVRRKVMWLKWKRQAREALAKRKK